MGRIKSAVKVAAGKKSISYKKESMQVLQLENNVPMPKRGMRDPEFVTKASELLQQIKIKQSFVIPKNKVYAIKKINKTDFSHLALRTTLIKPQNEFARVCRIK